LDFATIYLSQSNVVRLPFILRPGGPGLCIHATP
jgi:hypothetical protein